MGSPLGLASISLLSIWTVVLLYFQFLPFQSKQPAIWIHHASDEIAFESVKPKEIRKNIWSDLTAVEAEGLRVWLHQPELGLDLTPPKNVTPGDNYIQLFEILLPNKTDVLPYLDHQGEEPQRYARVAIINSSEPNEKSTIDEYMVGPLPISAETSIEPLTYIYNSGRSRTPSRDSTLQTFRKWVSDLTVEIYDIAHDLFNLTMGPDGNPNFVIGSVDPFWVENGRDVAWCGFMQNTGARSVLPQALYLKIDFTGQNISDWNVTQLLYNGILYNNISSLKEAWSSPDFVKLPANLDGNWTQLRPKENPTHDLPPPPKFHQSGPSRIFVDESEKFVSWLNFTFSISFSQVTALSLFDIRVDDERVFYELGFQEALAHYAGDDPKLSGTAFLDTSFSFGALLAELIPGYDCPDYATYLSTEFHRSEESFPRKNTICVFERPMDFPIQRHTDKMYTASFTSTTLVVRSIATIGNYDYLIDYIFYADGSIEVKVRASGYIQGAYALHNQLYGYKVRDALSTAMHDHVLNFKADLDIAGHTSNTFQRVDITAKDITYPWAPTTPRKTMVLAPSNVTSESQGSLNWPSNSGSMYLITSPETNQWGEKRSYRILPGTGIGTPSHLTILNSSNLLNASRWAEHDLYITRQHDTEPRSCSPLNGFTPSDPLVNFAKFLQNNESLVEEDLVLWFNLGGHHVPTSGDIPNTVMVGSASSVLFSPFNFWDRDRSMDWAKGVRVEHPEGDKIRWMSTSPDDGYWVREDGEDGEIAMGHEDLRVRSRGADALHRKGPEDRIEFFGPKRQDQEVRDEMERLGGFEGLRMGEMKEYMPTGRDIEVF